MDPQQRVFLEICWECLERAGYAPDQRARGRSACSPACTTPPTSSATSRTRPDLIEKLGEFQVMLANEKDYIATRVANKLNLTGPAVSVHTACSTSLVAIAQAVVSLRAGQCDMALAGGASITCPPRSGYLYQEGAMLSPDGHTRSFDADAEGTVFSDGATVVLLKRLSDALADGDTVLCGASAAWPSTTTAAHKASFTAPSVDGQAAVIAAAHARRRGRCAQHLLRRDARHGHAAGRPGRGRGADARISPAPPTRGFCRIGSLKSNVGHMVTAAGAAGVIKTALALATETAAADASTSTRPIPRSISRTARSSSTTGLTAWPRERRSRGAPASAASASVAPMPTS